MIEKTREDIKHVKDYIKNCHNHYAANHHLYSDRAKAYEAAERLEVVASVLKLMASGDDWFPIESAPTDGEKIIVRGEAYKSAKWSDEVDKGPYPARKSHPSYKQWDGIGYTVYNPTHWKHIDTAKHIKMLMEKVSDEKTLERL